MQAHISANNISAGRDAPAHQLTPATSRPASADASADLELPDPDLSHGTLSPAGFSSVSSPAGSVTSPLTPAGWLQTLALNHSPNYGAFKPPTPQRSHDPRDAKHPLSICQLTGNSDESKNLCNSTSENNLRAAICAASASAAILGLR